MLNETLAKIFEEMADIYDYLNVKWKPMAFRSASATLLNTSLDMADLTTLEEIEALPGIGEGIGKKILEFKKTGKISEHQKLLSQIGKNSLELLNIEGIGPKTLRSLKQKLNVNNITELEAALRERKLEKIPHFGKKSQDKIFESLQIYKQGKERIPISYALPIAEDIANYFQKNAKIQKIDIVGSIKRRLDTIGDIDILLVSKENCLPLIKRYPEVKQILSIGNKKASIILKNNLKCDIRQFDKSVYGAAEQYFTGNKNHNITLRNIAIKKGYKLSEYGLFNRKTNKLIVASSEKDIYQKLNLPNIPPELRENNLEFTKEIPKLIDESDIISDLHTHSTFSDGFNSIEEMVIEAIKLKRKEIAITDHSQSLKIANGLSVERLNEKALVIKQLQKKYKKIKILHGSEVDILSDETLDYDNKTLGKLDVVVASIHTGLGESKTQLTNRTISALENKHVDIIGHPTSRYLGLRKEFELDWKTIFDTARIRKKALEINCQKNRLDLSYKHANLAIENGVKLAINTDAHSTEQLHTTRYGIFMARKAWATKKDIINTKRFL